MATLVKSILMTSIIDGIYNDITTKNANYYYFIGRTNIWTEADGATAGVDGVVLNDGLVEPNPIDTQKYEAAIRTNAILYKSVKPSDISFIIDRIQWVQDTVYDMYDDAYDYLNAAYSGATDLINAKFYVLTSSNNVYKCISNNYDSKSTVEPTGTSTSEFITADGYVWKFMYKIPSSLQNKFYTADLIPVMTSLKDRFYENGAILNVAVQDTGSGYTGNASLIVSGDGFLENNPYALGHYASVVVGGKGYRPNIAPTAITWSLGVATFSFATPHGYLNGDKVSVNHSSPIGYNGDFTIVDVPDPTSFKVNIVNYPGAYVGSADVSHDIVTISAPLWGTSPIQALAHANIDVNGVVTQVELDEALDPESNVVYGYGYDNSATITIASPFPNSVNWVVNGTYTLGQILKAGNNFYEVTDAGIANATMPVHTSGSVTYDTADDLTLLYVGTQAQLLLSKTKTEAIMTPIVQGGAITGVTVVDGGIGYTYCNISTLDTPPNTSAILTADISIGDVDTVQSNVELSAVDGSLSYIKLEKDNFGRYIRGSGYGPDTTVEITGDGTGATAEAILENGSIKEIRLLNHGSGYTKDVTVTILPPKIDGNNVDYGAKARAIISSVGGHGKNAIQELMSRSIMLYTVLADERIHKSKNLNDYRQFGVIKNPKRFGLTSRLTATVAQACHLLVGSESVNLTKFKVDDEINQSNGSMMRIVLIDDTHIVAQTINNIMPVAGIIYNSNPLRLNESMTINSITSPDVDKYSGQMLFVENKLPFVITADQVVTFRTIIGFD